MMGGTDVNSRVAIGRLHPAQLKRLPFSDPTLTDRIDSAAWGYPRNLPAREAIPGSK